jgi:CheY-like chemotaxis protein
MTMPGKDGWQVLHDLNNNPQTRNILVIMCNILKEEEKGLSLGASDYLVKPILQGCLIVALNRQGIGRQVREVIVVDDDSADLRLIQRMIETNNRFQVTLAHGENPQ